MTVLITGAAGFIGSHLAETLHRGGRNVLALDDLSTGRMENLSALLGQDGFRFVEGSVRDENTVATLVEQSDCVVHLAAAVGVQLIVDEPVRTLETNIHGSEVVLAQANRCGRRVLLASTSEVYGKSAAVPFREDDDVVLGSTRFTRWSYAASKMVDEFLALAYHDQYGLETIIVRLFNTVGPRQSGQWGMVVPRFVRAALRGETLRVFGSGEQSRCFSHVADVVEALATLLDCDEAVGQVVNVGADEPITIRQLAERIIERTDSASTIETVSYEQAYGREFDDMLVRRPDLSRVAGLIGYTPARTFEQTLQDVIDYERRAMNKEQQWPDTS
jgi:UDP-glucose 4-epimerase